MQTLLVLYMVRQLLHPGHIEHIAGFTAFRAAIERAYGAPLSTVALASAIFGLYSGLVYLTPIAGGIIADRWLGRTRTVTIGALLMAAGHFLMAFDMSFLIALMCLLTGVGCFKGNIASQVGALYAPSDLRRADAFQIYFLFINGAVIVAPLIAGTLGEVYGWHYGFRRRGRRHADLARYLPVRAKMAASGTRSDPRQIGCAAALEPRRAQRRHGADLATADPGDRRCRKPADLQRLLALGTEQRRHGVLRSYNADHMADYR